MSTHRRKQLLYGFLYLVIISGIVGGIYYLFLIPEPSCFDNIQNQNETSVDCGGSCIDCELLTLTLTKGKPQVFEAGDSKSTIFVEITNPSSNYGLSSFDYQFKIFSTLGTVIKKFSGRSYISANESKYLIEPGININVKDIGGVTLDIPEENWETKKTLSTYDLVTKTIKTTIVSGSVEVAGTLSNNSPKNYSSVTVIAIIYNRTGEMINTSSTKLDNITAFRDNLFTVFFPKLASVYGVDLNATKVFYEVKN